LSTLSIVTITILASLFAILLLASMAALIYVYILTRRQLSQLSLLIGETRTNIASSHTKIETLIASVHGDQISKAAEAFLEQIPKQAAIATRIEKAVVLYIDTLRHVLQDEGISGSALERARESGLGPEDYAPAAPGERFVSQSRTAVGDAAALAGESGLNSFDAESPDETP